MRSWLWLVVVALAFPAGCARKKEPPPAPPPPQVMVAKPVQFPVQKYLEFNGYLEAVETVQITARVKGFLNDITFTEGAEVKKGDPLFVIDPREFEASLKKAQGDKLKATAEVKRAKADEDRGRQLLTSQAISQEEFQQRVAARETADAVLKQSEAAIDMAQLQLDYTKISAPIDGQINRTLVTRGNLVGQTEPSLLTTIVGMEEIFAYFDVPERDLIEYQRGLQNKPESKSPTGSHPVHVGISTEDGFPHAGVIDFRENKVDTSTGTVRLRGRLKNPKIPPGNVRMLYPGLYARVRIPMGEPKPQLVIPEDALLTGQEGRYVYVIGENNIVQKRTVTVGANVWRAAPKGGPPAPWTLTSDKPPAEKKDGPPAVGGPPPTPPPVVRSVVAIDDGLKEGDRVIINGLQRARPGAPATPDEWTFHGPDAKK